MSLGWLKQLQMTAVNDFVSIASSERVFIYLLLLDSEHLHSSQPFFVGQANNLRKRLSNHAAVNWHLKKFGKGPKIWVAGSIHLNFAEKAVEDLKNQLLLRDVLLLNARKEGDVGLKNASIADLRRYTLETKELTGLIQKWDIKWGLKHKVVDVSVVGAEISLSTTVVKSVSSATLQKVIRGRSYKTVSAVALSQRLAKGFNEATQESKLIVPDVKSEKKQKRLIEDLKHLLVDIAADWETVAGELTPGSVIVMKPTFALYNHVTKVAQKASQ